MPAAEVKPSNTIRRVIGNCLCAAALLVIKRKPEYDGSWIVSRNDHTIQKPTEAFAAISERIENKNLLRFFTRISPLFTRRDPKQNKLIAVPSHHYPID